MKQWIGLVAALALAAAFGGTTYAQQDGAGCGLGSELFSGQSGIVPHVLAVTSNGFSGNQTFGISSGTSGCNADSVIIKDKEKEAFVAANMEVLSSESARGAGASLDALAELMGCPTALAGDFGAVAQASYPVLYAQPAPEPQVWLHTLEQELKQAPVLSASCTQIG